VFFENTGLMKAGPAKAQFEPTEGKTVKFSDVHGVDEAKEVGLRHFFASFFL
jgi:ATP-dependent metalloprotease